jgi:hypothetical protein
MAYLHLIYTWWNSGSPRVHILRRHHSDMHQKKSVNNTQQSPVITYRINSRL